MKRRITLGVYARFPEKCHYTALFMFNAPESSLKRAMLNTLYKMNGRGVEGSTLGFFEPSISIILEFGVADGLTFHYLDAGTLKILSDVIERHDINMLDFLCVARYYILRGERKRALRFDYYFLRFIFNDSSIEVRAFHERGLQRISTDDLANFLIKNINMELLKEK